MGRLNTYGFLGFLLIALSANSVIGQQKVGYVDTDHILANMSEYQGVQQQLASQSSEWNKELAEIEKEIEKLKEDFQAREILFTDKLRKEKQQEIDRKVEQRQQFLDNKFGVEGEYFQLQRKLLEPIQRKVMDAVTTVARREGFDYIFDRAENSDMLYANSEWNLNDRVLQELGITLNKSSN